jgi:hypothetical protein
MTLGSASSGGRVRDALSGRALAKKAAYKIVLNVL